MKREHKLILLGLHTVFCLGVVFHCYTAYEVRKLRHENAGYLTLLYSLQGGSLGIKDIPEELWRIRDSKNRI